MKAEAIISNLQHKKVAIDPAFSLLDNLHKAGVDWMHACGKKGRCTTCKAIVVKLEGELSDLSEHELRFASMNRLSQNERLTCQTFLKEGTVWVKVPVIYQLPHMQYSEHE